ncbi:hypothetical protein ABZP36_023895 [Zizania latifolia]
MTRKSFGVHSGEQAKKVGTELGKTKQINGLVLRCRDKQRKESSRLQTVNRKLTAMNKLLMEENERL